MNQETPEAVQVLIVGAGPVGLFAGLCAARQGLEVLLLDHVWRGYGRGHATLLHGSVLQQLDELGLRASLEKQGSPVESVTLRVDDAPPLSLPLPSPALAVPQGVLEEVLTAALRREDVEIRAPHEASTIDQHADHVDVRVMRRELVTLGSPADYSEWAPIDSSVVRTGFVIGADGYASRVRTALGIESVDMGELETFAMFEFPAHEVGGSAAQLCFRGGLGSVMLPLHGARTRWGFQLDRELDKEPDLARLRALLAERAPWYVDGTDHVDWGTVIHFERRLARRFGRGRVWLAGDSAHVTSPFGNHSMNVGLLEAHELTHGIADCVRRGAPASSLAHYGAQRERDWHKLLGVNVSFELLPHAPPWLAQHARRIVPALPASGAELVTLLETLGLRLS